MILLTGENTLLMANKYYLVILYFIFFGSCRPNNNNTLEGAWYMIDNDSIYHELYFNNTEFGFNFEEAVGFPTMHYLIQEESAYSYDKDPEERRLLFDIIRHDADSVLIKFNGQIVILKKFELGYDPFKNHLSAIEREVMFENRMMNKKIILGIENISSVNSDSLLRYETDFENLE